jgi:hypothetical protein
MFLKPDKVSTIGGPLMSGGGPVPIKNASTHNISKGEKNEMQHDLDVDGLRHWL